MAYIGKQPTVGNFQVCDAITVVNGQAAYTMQVSSSNVEPENANHIVVSLNGILQKPGSSFTISGSTITFASNLATGDVIDFIILLGNVLDLGTPSDGTVTNAKLAQDIISAETAFTSEPADTDEFLVSDAGTLKRIDYSLIKGGNTHTLLSTTTVSSAVSEVDISSNIDSTYKSYMIDILNFSPATNAQELRVRFLQGGSVDTGSVYDSHQYQMNADDGSGPTSYKNANTDHLGLADEVRNNAEDTLYARCYLYDPANTATDTKMGAHVIYARSDTASQALFTGRIEETAAVDGIRFYMASGNIDGGIFKLYGIT